MKCEYCKKDKKNCKASINNIASTGDMGTYTESLHSNEIGSKESGKPWIDVTEEVLERYNPYFTRKT